MSIRKNIPHKIFPTKVQLLKALPWILWITLVVVNLIAVQAPPPNPPGGYE